MEQDEIKDQANEPIAEYGKYSYADYLNWQFEEMVELIRGRVFRNAVESIRKFQVKYLPKYITFWNIIHVKCMKPTSMYVFRLGPKGMKI